MIVVVKSAASNVLRRKVTRWTWASFEYIAGLRMEIVFIVGNAKTPEDELELLHEHKKYGDLLQIDSQDTYQYVLRFVNTGWTSIIRHSKFQDHFEISVLKFMYIYYIYKIPKIPKKNKKISKLYETFVAMLLITRPRQDLKTEKIHARLTNVGQNMLNLYMHCLNMIVSDWFFCLLKSMQQNRTKNISRDAMGFWAFPAELALFFRGWWHAAWLIRTEECNSKN